MSTNSEFRPATLQATFDRIVEVLAARGWTQALSEAGTCKYRSSIGPCAVGIFISDAEYDPEWDNRAQNAESVILNCYPLYEWVSSVEDLHRFIVDAQCAHDFEKFEEDSLVPIPIRRRFILLGEQYDLDVSRVPE